MRDLEDLREVIIAAQRDGDPRDPLRQATVSGLTRLFNRAAPARSRLTPSPGVILAITPGRMLPARETGKMVDFFAKAVASIGQEVLHPGRSRSSVVKTDFDRVPFIVDTHSGGSIRLVAAPPTRVMGAAHVQGLTAQAMTRLVNVLPTDPDDAHVRERVESARPPTARALREVASAARLATGITIALQGTSEPVTASMDAAQADLIEDVLEDETVEVSKHRFSGRLDGLRYSRRLFFLERAHEPEVVGSIDESLVARVHSLLNQPVIAHVEKVVRRDVAGRRGRPSYRLVGLDEEPNPPADLMSG